MTDIEFIHRSIQVLEDYLHAQGKLLKKSKFEPEIVTIAGEKRCRIYIELWINNSLIYKDVAECDIKTMQEECDNAMKRLVDTIILAGMNQLYVVSKSIQIKDGHPK